MNRTVKSLLFGGPGSSTVVGDAGLLVLRLIGLMMAIGHGWSKMFHDGQIGPADQFVQGLTHMGVPAPTLSAWLSTLAELIGGLLVGRPMAFVLVINMTVAILSAHLHDPVFRSGPGPSKEPALLYLIPFLAIMLLGPGRFSLDAQISRSRSAA